MSFQCRPINITIYGTEVGNGFITWDGFFIPLTSICSTNYSPKPNFYEYPYKCCIYERRSDPTIRKGVCEFKETTCSRPTNMEWRYVGESSPVPLCSDCDHV
ncbi:hypothetical protein COO05_23510 [Bacillus toyonensis]|nr:hypothetical protein COO05_23510 [Bacillus toyonensis]